MWTRFLGWFGLTDMTPVIGSAFLTTQEALRKQVTDSLQADWSMDANLRELADHRFCRIYQLPPDTPPDMDVNGRFSLQRNRGEVAIAFRYEVVVEDGHLRISFRPEVEKVIDRAMVQLISDALGEFFHKQWRGTSAFVVTYKRQLRQRNAGLNPEFRQEETSEYGRLYARALIGRVERFDLVSMLQQGENGSWPRPRSFFPDDLAVRLIWETVPTRLVLYVPSNKYRNKERNAISAELFSFLEAAAELFHHARFNVQYV